MSRKKKYARKKKNGTTYYFYRMKDPTSSWGYHDVYGKTVKELEEKIKERQALIDAGITDQNVRFGPYVERIFESKIIGDLKASTAKHYNLPLSIFQKSTLSNQRLIDLTPYMLNSWLSSLELAQQALTTLSVMLRKALKQAFKEGLTIRDLSKTIETPKTDQPAKYRRAGRLLSESEISELLTKLDGSDKLLSAFLLDTGLRIGEALALEWTDVDFDNSTVSVSKSIDQVGVVTSPKTKSSIRTVPVSPSILTQLAKSRLERREHAFKDTSFTFDQEAVFIDDSTGERKTYRTFTLHLKKTGIDVKPHDFRHTNASRLNESGINPLVVAKWLGHSKMDTTVNVYTDVTENLEKQSIAILMGQKQGQI